MDFLFVASVCVITCQPERDIALYTDTIGLPLRPPSTVPGSGYRYSEEVEGTKHFGVWPLAEAAQACFGQPDWPGSHPVPQATIEFEVADVDAAAAELESAGYQLVHGARTEPWGQRVARFQSKDGLLLGVCQTPHLAGRGGIAGSTGVGGAGRYSADLRERRAAVRDTTVAALAALPGVVGVWAVGSAARGEQDDHSDVDLVAALAEEAHEEAARSWLASLAGLDEPLHTDVMGFADSTTVNIVLPPWVRLDVSFVPATSLERRVAGTAVHLAGSAEGAPAARRADSRRALSDEEVGKIVAEFYRVLALAPVAVGRGDLLLATMGLGMLRDLTIRVVRATQTSPDPGGMMHLKDQLPGDAYERLLAISTPTPEPGAIVEAHAAVEELFWPVAAPLLAGSPRRDELERMRLAALEHFRRAFQQP